MNRTPRPFQMLLSALLPIVGLPLAGGASVAFAQPAETATAPSALRVATFNLEDVRTDDLLDDRNPRIGRLAEILQRIRPNIVLLNEIAYDEPGVIVPNDTRSEAARELAGLNASRFVDHFLEEPQAPGLRGLRYKAVMLRSNTGLPSGLDLDNSGEVAENFPELEAAGPDGSPARQTAEGRAFGNDAWGFGTFPGQYAMALLVDERLTVREDQIRTFRLLRWSSMPDAARPIAADGSEDGESWFSDEEWERVRLSSKSHWDVPVVLPNGRTLHLLCSHPTPPAFDGPEQRNKRRNHDEIRFWADYLDNAAYIVDDQGRRGGLREGEAFVILGDLNADPVDGSSYRNPIRNLLFASPRVDSSFTPTSDVPVEGLDASDTSHFRLRVDHVIPSKGISILNGGVWRHGENHPDGFPSDHFPVWLDVAVPPRSGR